MRIKTNTGSAHRGPQAPATYLRFPGTTFDIRLENAEDVGIALAMALETWVPERNQETWHTVSTKNFATPPKTDQDDVFIENPSDSERMTPARVSCVYGEAGGYRTRSVYLDEDLSGLGVAGAACAVIADLAQDFFEARPGYLALHCAAFRYNDTLVAMAGPARAGKSTLAARLTQETDIEVFCDDVLPLAPDGSAIGLGIAPRLRLPLPTGASPAFQAHVACYMGPRDERYGYLCTRNIAPHGTRAALSVLLLLDRRDRADARLHDVADDDALRFLVSRNMADLHTAQDAFARLTAVLAGLRCLRLVYSDLEDAIALIRRAFGPSLPGTEPVEIGPPLPFVPQDTLPETTLSPHICWARNPDVVLQTRADSAFLWQPGKQVIWHLNALGLAIWALLEIPGTATELGAALHEHFPEMSLGTLTHDANALLDALARAGLVHENAEQPSQA